MQRIGCLALCTVTGIILSGCMNPRGYPDYTASGAVAGAATGAIIGGMSRHPGPAGVAGMAVGAVVGSIIGSELDQAQAARLRDQAPQTMRRVEESQPLTPGDVVSLTKAGVGDELIIKHIRQSRTIFRLKSGEIVELKEARVSEAVLDCMLDTVAELHPPEGQYPTGTVVQRSVIVAPGPEVIYVGGRWLWPDYGWDWHDGYWRRPHPPGR